ncbi:MAG TPA: TIM barrel protein [Sphingomicrobium sp.]|nr:TIM barrel protein [Sphingomicrobium sp.]
MTSPSPPNGLQLSAHIGYLFQHLPLEARFAAAREAGFRAVEIADPYALSPSRFQSLCEQNELEVAQIAVPNGVAGASKKGLAALPGRECEFCDALKLSIEFATAVNCSLIHPMAGIRAPLEPSPDWKVYLSNLEKACFAAADAGLRIIIEVISADATRNYFLNSFAQACAAIEQLDAPNLLLSIDTYHAAAIGVQIPSFIVNNSSKIGHVQVADWPDRNEPGSGQIAFNPIFGALKLGGYKGYVGLEYLPSSDHAATFDWARLFETYLEPLRATSISSRS